VRKVQKFRFWSALKKGHMRLADIPRESFAALAEQTGLETAFVARVFQKYQLKLDLHLAKHQLTRGQRRGEHAALSPRPPSARVAAAGAAGEPAPRSAGAAAAADGDTALPAAPENAHRARLLLDHTPNAALPTALPPISTS
jgi:hypothetical protein